MTVDRFEIVLPDQPVESLDDWLAAGGGRGLTRARELGPEATIAELQRAGRTPSSALLFTPRLRLACHLARPNVRWSPYSVETKRGTQCHAVRPRGYL